MQYANVNSLRIEATPNLRGICPVCGARTIPKCGKKVIWHWAHVGHVHCDPWWENETEWHRAWKQCFAPEHREIVKHAPDGERHIADVQTASGMVIEFQNSPMSAEELRSREQFYARMIWIVNAAQFAKQFFVMSPIPDPVSALGRDIVLLGGQKPIPHLKPSPLAGLMFWLRSENLGQTGMVRIRGSSEFHDAILESYRGHHLFHWLRPRDVWLSATAPVFLDFGDDMLWWLQIYDAEYNIRAIRRVSKAALVAKNGGDLAAIQPPTGYTPIHPQVAPDDLRRLWHS